MKQYIRLIGPVDTAMVTKLFEELAAFERKPRSIVYIEVCSEGGEVGAALAIAGRIRSSVCEITTIGYGMVHSAAVLILAAGHKRKAHSFTEFMLHESPMKLKGTVSELKPIMARAERDEETWALYMQKCSKMSSNHWRTMVTGGDWYINAELAKLFGIIDEIMDK